MVRGLLILLVLAGHVLEQEAPAGLAKWLIYGFHMPLFLGLSGFLLDRASLRARSWRMIARHHGRRLLLPWSVAIVIYMAPGWQELTWATPADILLHPPFHLWFVPVLLAYIMLAKLLPLGAGALCLLAAAVSGAALGRFGIGHDIAAAPRWMPDLRYLVYASFFFLGLWRAGRPVRSRTTLAAMALVIGGTGGWLWCYWHPSPSGEVMFFLAMNIGLVGLLPWLRSHIRRFTLPVIECVGLQSLFFYLWHPLVMGWLQIAGLTGAMLLAAMAALLFVGQALLRGVPVARRLTGLQLPAA